MIADEITAAGGMPGKISKISSTSDNLYEKETIIESGFKEYNFSPNFSDEWVSVERDQGDSFSYEKSNITGNPIAFYILIMTLAASSIFSFYLTKQFVEYIFKVQRHIISKILLINIY